MSVVVPLENDPHAVVQGLLPWYARGQLDDVEMLSVQQHLQQCDLCRAELAAEQSLQALRGLPEPVAGDGEVALARLMPRLTPRAPQARQTAPASTPRAAGRRSRPATPAGGVPLWVRWTLGVQGAAIALLLVLLVLPHEELAVYRGLSDAGAPVARDADALIMFRPELSEQAMRRLLQAHGASIVGGPTESGAYRLRLSGAPVAALAGLRAEPGVTLVESLMPGARP